MPLHILLILVVGGIAGIAVILHVLGLSKTKRFDTEEAARQAWLNEFPDTSVDRVILSHDQSAALIETADGPGVVWPMGADSTARYLTNAHIVPRQGGISIRLPDYTAPRITLHLDPDEVDYWTRDIEGRTT